MRTIRLSIGQAGQAKQENADMRRRLEELSLFAEAKKANVDFAKALKPYLPETSDQRISKLEQKIDMLIDSLGGQKNS